MDYTKFKMTRDEFNADKYQECAIWCNENGHRIVENDGIFTVEKVEIDKEYVKYCEYKLFLTDTDYVVSKASELLVLKGLGLEYSEDDLSRYQEIIAERQEKRKFVSDYEDVHKEEPENV